MSDAMRAAANASDATLLRDRVTAAFGDHYLVGRELGRGGMAVVYAAEDVRLQRHVALKVLPPDLAFRSDVRERFVREAQTAARLNHPHIVPIYAVHEQAGMVCFAMGLVDGDSVAARLQREPRPSVEFIAAVLEQTADALAYAHACGVVHRDVKPDNILLDRESGRAMVTDFGIARAAESGSRLTQTGIAVGTPAFMSPEQATGERDVDGRSDLYSLGVVGYLMLAGRLPFEAATTPAMLVKHVSEIPPPILSVRPDAPGALVGILEKCLAKRPADRWDSALLLRDALRRVQRDGSLKRTGDARPAPALVREPAPRPLAPPSAQRPMPLVGQREPSAGAGLLPRPRRIERAVRAFKRHARWLAGSAATAVVSFAIGAGFNIDPMAVPFVIGLIGTAVSGSLLMLDALKLHRFGITPGDAMSDGWKEIAAVSDDRPRHVQLEDALALVAGPSVLASLHGDTVRSAVDDRLTIRDTASKLSDADKALVPDVEPTADALLERISALAAGLERLERDIPGDAIGKLNARIAATESEPETAPDRERRLTLLTRQRASLQELLERKGTMQHQLESASLALHSLRLDMVKLRTLGVGAAIGDVNNATQEARALSVDIGRALYAADEVRKL